MKRAAILVAWLAALAAAGLWLTQSLQPATDLTAFLPADSAPENAALLDELRDGATTRLILIAIEGAEPAELAALSKQLAASLRDEDSLQRIDNGRRDGGEELLALAREHRYQLTPNDLAQRLSTQGLRQALQARLRDLGSAMEMAVKDLLAVDPTHETLAVLERWRPHSEPPRRHGVWFDTAGERALLVAKTVAPGFDLDGQARAVGAIQQAFDELDSPVATLTLTGPGPFGVMLRDTTQREAQLFSSAAVAALMLFLLLVYRQWPLLIHAGLPLASGVLAALVAVQLVFGGIHGITLAFGVTLLGVAIDYPLHLISHRRVDETAMQGMRRIWPTLRLGVLSTCIAYLTLLFSEFPGLAQLGLFTVVGLLAAAASTRWLLPLLLPAARSDAGSGFIRHWQHALHSARLPVLSLWLLLGIASAVLVWGHEDLWEDDLGALTPVPVQLQATDTRLRQALGAAELRQLLLIEAADQQTVLQTSETAAERLRGLVQAGQLRGFDQPARYLPSRARQQAQQQALPDADSLRARLGAAAQGLPFRDRLFEPFLQAVAAARQATPLGADIYADTAMAARLDALLKPTKDGRWRALLPLQGINNIAAVQAALRDLPHSRLVDLKTASENMVAGFRSEALWRIAAAGLAIVLIAAWGLPRRQWLRVLLPVLATVLAEAALFRLAGLPLTLFHLVSLMLVGGIVLDYALFFNRQDEAPAEQARTLHALTVCAVSTLTVFGILALSEIPVLRAIGVTVAAGVLIGYTLAALTAQGTARSKPDKNAST